MIYCYDKINDFYLNDLFYSYIKWFFTLILTSKVVFIKKSLSHSQFRQTAKSRKSIRSERRVSSAHLVEKKNWPNFHSKPNDGELQWRRGTGQRSRRQFRPAETRGTCSERKQRFPQSDDRRERRRRNCDQRDDVVGPCNVTADISNTSVEFHFAKNSFRRQKLIWHKR